LPLPSPPFDAAHQTSFSAGIGKVLPDARAQHIAEVVAAGHGYRTHNTLLAAIRAAEAGCLAHTFDTAGAIYPIWPAPNSWRDTPTVSRRSADDLGSPCLQGRRKTFQPTHPAIMRY